VAHGTLNDSDICQALNPQGHLQLGHEAHKHVVSGTSNSDFSLKLTKRTESEVGPALDQLCGVHGTESRGRSATGGDSNEF
jgi:hypothetical protein